jgi:hypothetical protein
MPAEILPVIAFAALLLVIMVIIFGRSGRGPWPRR